MTETGNVTPGFKTDSDAAKRLRAQRSFAMRQLAQATATHASLAGFTDAVNVATDAKAQAAITRWTAAVASCEAQLDTLVESYPVFESRERYK